MEIDNLIAARLRTARAARNWSLEQLAHASGVSRAMISKVERVQASATAALLSKLAAALDVPLSHLVMPPAARSSPSRKAERPQWRDPQTGYLRELVVPRAAGSRVEIVEVALPPRTRVPYHQPAKAGYSQHIVVLQGTLRIVQQQAEELAEGDALSMNPEGAFSFENIGPGTCRYLVVLERNGSQP